MIIIFRRPNYTFAVLYFSVLTFMTFAFGDITPVSTAGKVWVILEVVAGYLMLGVLITLVARKMTR